MPAATVPTAEARAALCLRCGYSLRGLGPPDVCPECGAPAGRAFEPHWLHFEPAARIRRYEWGALLLAVAALLLLLAVLAIARAALVPGGPGGVRWLLSRLAVWGSTLAAPLAAVGILLVTLGNAARGSRAAIACLAVAAVTLPVVAWMRPALGGPISPTTHLSTRVVFLSAWIGIMFFGVCVLAATTARTPAARALPRVLTGLAWTAVPLGAGFIAAQALLSLAIVWLGQSLDGSRPAEYITQMLVWSRQLSVVSGIGWVLLLLVAAPALFLSWRAMRYARQAATRARN